MTGDQVPHTTGVQRVKAGMVFAEFGSDDPFEIAFRPAAVVLDAAVALRGSLIWLDRQRQGNKRLSLLDLSRASQNRDVAVQRCEAIPKDDELYRAMRPFESAEYEPALEGWVHIAIGIGFIEAVEIALDHGFNGGTILAHGLKSSAGRGAFKLRTENCDLQGRTGGDAPLPKIMASLFEAGVSGKCFRDVFACLGRVTWVSDMAHERRYQILLNKPKCWKFGVSR